MAPIAMGLISLAVKALPKLADVFTGKASIKDASIDVIKDVVGKVTGQDDVEQGMKLLEKDPQLFAQFRQQLLEHQHIMHLLAFGDEDRANARSLQKAALNQSDPVAKRFVYWFAWFWACAAMSYLFAVTFAPAEYVNNHAADIGLGFMLGTAVSGILQFFYGRTKAQDDDAEIRAWKDL